MLGALICLWTPIYASLLFLGYACFYDGRLFLESRWWTKADAMVTEVKLYEFLAQGYKHSVKMIGLDIYYRFEISGRAFTGHGQVIDVYSFSVEERSQAEAAAAALIGKVVAVRHAPDLPARNYLEPSDYGRRVRFLGLIFGALVIIISTGATLVWYIQALK